MQAKDRPSETVEVPEWGGSVIVSTMSGADRDEFHQWMNEQPRPIRSRPFIFKLLSLTLVDEQGARMFGPAEERLLAIKGEEAIGRLYVVSARLNKLGEEEVEAEAGKSAGVHGDGSSSGSPSTSA